MGFRIVFWFPRRAYARRGVWGYCFLFYLCGQSLSSIASLLRLSIGDRLDIVIPNPLLTPHTNTANTSGVAGQHSEAEVTRDLYISDTGRFMTNQATQETPGLPVIKNGQPSFPLLAARSIVKLLKLTLGADISTPERPSKLCGKPWLCDCLCPFPVHPVVEL